MKGWKAIVGAVAPTLATALGGPLAGLAVRQIGEKVLGNGAVTEADVATAIAAGSPETLLRLKELDQQFARDMAQMGVELEKLESADRADARARQVATRDWMPNALGIGLMLAFFSVQFWMLGHDVPAGTKELLTRTLGTLDASLAMVLSFYFGSSRGSRAKDEILGRAVTQK